MKDSKAPEPLLPFVWPLPDDKTESDRDDPKIPIKHLFADAGSVAGVISEIDAEGVSWLKTLLCEPDRKALIVLAVYAGCPTRSEHLALLLEFQERQPADSRFRILPMTSVHSTPSTCLTVIPRGTSDPICLFGTTPNIGIAKLEPTQYNVAFRSEPVLTDKWCGWFDKAWAQAAPLTESTAKIPNLVPARGSAEAAAQWRKYCILCSTPKQDERTQTEEKTQPDEASAALVQDDGNSTETAVPHQGEDQSASASIGLRRLDRLVKRVTRILSKGQQVTVVYGGAVKPLDIPISARFFDQDPEERKGTVVRRQTFRISAFSKDEQKMIDNHRKASRLVINKLGLPFEKGLCWVPYEMIPIIKNEIAAVEEEAKAALIRLVGPYAGTFVEGKRMQIKQDLEQTYRDLVGQGDLPKARLTEVLDRLERRIQDALESEIVAPVTFHSITIDLQRKNAHEAPWAQMDKLVLALACFPRQIISNPKTLSGITTDRHSILKAMNIEDDSILRVMNDSLKQAIRFSRSDMDQLERIAGYDISERDRCKAYLMIIDGMSNSKVQKFVDKKWSKQRDKGTRSS